MPRVTPTSLPGVLIIEPEVYRDARGFFLETYHAAKYHDLGITPPFVQDNQSRSAAGVLRGIHLQTGPPQGKLVRVIRGAIVDVAVDLRDGSPTFGTWAAAQLSAENFLEMYIPAGFGHAFYVTDGPADVEYKVTTFYEPATELGIIWNDPDLAIEWPEAKPVMSDRDRSLPRLEAVRERLRQLNAYAGQGPSPAQLRHP